MKNKQNLKRKINYKLLEYVKKENVRHFANHRNQTKNKNE